MRILNRFSATFVIAAKRILSQPWMALATVIGMIFAISLVMSVPLYANSVYNRIFLQRVGYDAENQTTRKYPPFSFLFNFDSSIYGNLEWGNLTTINDYLKNRSQSVLNLPVQRYVRYIATDPLALFPASVKEFPDEEQPLLWSSLVMMDDFENHVDVVEGHYPKPSLDGPVEVLVNEDLANELGVQTGETYTLLAHDQKANGAKTTIAIPMRISGIYRVKDAGEAYWFINASMLKERLIIPEETFVKRISPTLNNEIYSAFWFLLVDGSSVRPSEAASLVARIQTFQRQAGQALPKINMAVSPMQDLYAYQRAANLLTVLLFAFSVPIFGLLLAFITMTAGMTVERQRNEIAILRSRGAMVLQMIGIAVVESLLLGAVALIISLPLSAGIAMLIGKTRSFLDFSSANILHLNWDFNTLYFGLGAILVTILARLGPTLRAARDNIVMYKRDRARSLRAPLWQRLWLDVLLMIPAGYGLYQLRQAGNIDVFGASAKGDPFANPLLIMVPALAIFSVSLFFMRLMPFLMRVITWVAARTRSVGIMMAARYLARTPSTYTLPTVLLILTLSLSAFTATLAGTLDHHLHDQIYYRIGSDVDFVDVGDNLTATLPQQAGDNAKSLASAPAGFLFLPVSDYLKLPGVEDATRVGRYQATAIFGNDLQTGQILGIDRTNLPNIVFWRPDFATESLGDLMNRLANTPDGVLVNQSFLDRNSLVMNDLITLRIVSYHVEKQVDFRVVGTVKLFPTYYPSDMPLFVANLDYIFESLGGEYPYHVWLKASGPVDLKQMYRQSYANIGATTISWEEPVSQINSEQARPERQGLFGVLSVGFGAAALLTVLGFLLYALLSYQRRFVELGVLRAIGLSTAQMTYLLAAELAFLILMGGMIGTALGVWVSNNFIPFLQIGADPQSQFPPYVVYIAWPAILRVYALFGALFVAALVILVVLLRRMRIFQAIKMGESV